MSNEQQTADESVYSMSNDQLAAAIDASWNRVRRTGCAEQCFKSCLSNLENLLQIQVARAAYIGTVNETGDCLQKVAAIDNHERWTLADVWKIGGVQFVMFDDVIRILRRESNSQQTNESHSGGNTSEKSEGRHSDHRGITSARSSEGGITGERPVESIQSPPVSFGDIWFCICGCHNYQGRTHCVGCSRRNNRRDQERKDSGISQSPIETRPHLCIKPACPSTCVGCNHAIDDTTMRQFAIKWASHIAGQPQPPLDTDKQTIEQLTRLIGMAYGHLWHVNNEPGTPAQYSPSRASMQARHILRDALTNEQRGFYINAIREALQAEGRNVVGECKPLSE